MEKRSELRQIVVNGEKWDIDIDYKDHEISQIYITNMGDIKVIVESIFDLEVVARNLVNIAEELRNEEV